MITEIARRRISPKFRKYVSQPQDCLLCIRDKSVIIVKKFVLNLVSFVERRPLKSKGVFGMVVSLGGAIVGKYTRTPSFGCAAEVVVTAFSVVGVPKCTGNLGQSLFDHECRNKFDQPADWVADSSLVRVVSLGASVDEASAVVASPGGEASVVIPSPDTSLASGVSDGIASEEFSSVAGASVGCVSSAGTEESASSSWAKIMFWKLFFLNNEWCRMV